VAAAARALLRPHTSETIRRPENKRLDMTKPNRDAAFGRIAIDRLCKSAASRSRAPLRYRSWGVASADAAAFGVGIDRLAIRSRFAQPSRRQAGPWP